MTSLIKVTDRNEIKFLLATGFTATPFPRDTHALDFCFEPTDALFEARRAFSLNHPVPVQSFIDASIFVEKALYAHRQSGGAR